MPCFEYFSYTSFDSYISSYFHFLLLFFLSLRSLVCWLRWLLLRPLTLIHRYAELERRIADAHSAARRARWRDYAKRALMGKAGRKFATLVSELARAARARKLAIADAKQRLDDELKLSSSDSQPQQQQQLGASTGDSESGNSSDSPALSVRAQALMAEIAAHEAELAHLRGGAGEGEEVHENHGNADISDATTTTATVVAAATPPPLPPPPAILPAPPPLPPPPAALAASAAPPAWPASTSPETTAVNEFPSTSSSSSASSTSSDKSSTSGSGTAAPMRRADNGGRSFDLAWSRAAVTVAALVNCGLLPQLLGLACGDGTRGRSPHLRQRGAKLALRLRDCAMELCPRQQGLELCNMPMLFQALAPLPSSSPSSSLSNVDNGNGSTGSSSSMTIQAVKSQAYLSGQFVHRLAKESRGGASRLGGGLGGGGLVGLDSFLLGSGGGLSSGPASHGVGGGSGSGGYGGMGSGGAALLDASLGVPPTAAQVMDGVDFSTFDLGFGLGSGATLAHCVVAYRRGGMQRWPMPRSDFRWGDAPVEAEEDLLNPAVFGGGAGSYGDYSNAHHALATAAAASGGALSPSKAQRRPSFAASLLSGGSGSSSGNTSAGGGGSNSSSGNSSSSNSGNSALVAQDEALSAAAASAAGYDPRDNISSGNSGSVCPELGALIAESKVLEIKDFVRWDWRAVWAIVDTCLTNKSAVAELLSRKWVKWAERVGGFFRTDLASGKAHFASLSWSRENLRYLHVASRYFGALSHSPEGRAFMATNRRASVLRDVLVEIDRVCRRADAERREVAFGKAANDRVNRRAGVFNFFRETVSDNVRESTVGFGGGGGGGNGQGPGGMGGSSLASPTLPDFDEDPTNYEILGRLAVVETMSREYLTLLLHATQTAQGSQVLLAWLLHPSPTAQDNAAADPDAAHAASASLHGSSFGGPGSVYAGLANLAQYPELDYLTTLLAFNLCFDAEAGWPRKLLEQWCAATTITEALALNLCSVLAASLGKSVTTARCLPREAPLRRAEESKSVWAVKTMLGLITKGPPPPLHDGTSYQSPFVEQVMLPQTWDQIQAQARVNVPHLPSTRLQHAVLLALDAVAATDLAAAELLAPVAAPTCAWLMRSRATSSKTVLSATTAPTASSSSSLSSSPTASKPTDPLLLRLLVRFMGTMPLAPSINTSLYPLDKALFGSEISDGESTDSEARSVAQMLLDEWQQSNRASSSNSSKYSCSWASHWRAAQVCAARAAAEDNRRAAAAAAGAGVRGFGEDGGEVSGGVDGDVPLSSAAGELQGDEASGSGWEKHLFDHTTASDSNLASAPKPSGNSNSSGSNDRYGASPRQGRGGPNSSSGGGDGGNADDVGAYGVCVPLGAMVHAADPNAVTGGAHSSTLSARAAAATPATSAGGKRGEASSGDALGGWFRIGELESACRLPWVAKVALTDFNDEARELRVATSVDPSSLMPFLAAGGGAVPDLPLHYRKTSSTGAATASSSSNSSGLGEDGHDVTTGAPPPASDSRVLVVRATVVDGATGIPNPLAISAADGLSATLGLGLDDVLGGGGLQSPPDESVLPPLAEGAEFDEGQADSELFEDPDAGYETFDAGDEDAFFNRDLGGGREDPFSAEVKSNCEGPHRDEQHRVVGQDQTTVVVIVPGQPCRWIFEQNMPKSINGSSSSGGGGRYGGSSSGGPALRLVAVEFLISLRDVLRHSAPNPPLLVAELAKSLPGQTLLQGANVLPDLLVAAFPTTSDQAAAAAPLNAAATGDESGEGKNDDSALVTTTTNSFPSESTAAAAQAAGAQEAALWALGTIGSSDSGLELLLTHRGNLLADLTRGATGVATATTAATGAAGTNRGGDATTVRTITTSSSRVDYLAVRRAFLAATHMCSAAPTAARLLMHCGWDFCAGPRAAVALPDGGDLGALFRIAPAPFQGSPALLRGWRLSSGGDAGKSALALKNNGAVGSTTERLNSRSISSGDGSLESGNGAHALAPDAATAKASILHAMANLVCNLTASEGKDKLLSAQRDFAALQTATSQTTTGGALAQPSTSTAATGGTGASSKGSSSGGGEGDAKTTSAEMAPRTPSGNVNVLADGAFYVEAFRATLCSSHLAVDNRRLVHHLFRNATFSTAEN